MSYCKFACGVALLLLSLTGCHRSTKVSIQGKVIDDVTGSPLVDAEVHLESHFQLITSNYYEKQTTRTDASGGFEFEGLRVRKAIGGGARTKFAIRASTQGYDCTTAYLESFRCRDDLTIRLLKDPDDPLPTGYVRLAEFVEDHDEPVLRFGFRNDRLELVPPEQAADFELIYKFSLGNKHCDNLMGCSEKSKSGKLQQIATISTVPNRVAQIKYEEPVGHPHRLPDVSTVPLQSSISFAASGRIWSSKHFLNNEFLLKTHDGMYALLHFDHRGISWVYQPDGSTNTRRLRKDVARYFWN